MRRVLKFAALAIAISAIAVAGTVAWLAYSPAAASWLVQQLVVRFEGQLAAGRVEGTLADGITVHDIAYTQGELRVDIDRAQAAWHWSALLDFRALFRKLQLGRVTVRLAPDAEPARLPGTLSIPLTVGIDAGRIDRLQIATQGVPFVIEDIDFRGSAGPAKHVVDAFAARFDEGRVNGAAEIDANRPFALQAYARFAPRTVAELPSAELTVVGHLSEMVAKFSAAASWLTAAGEAQLSPFERVLVRRLAARVDRIAVHERFPDTFQATLSATLELAQTAADRFEGDLRVANADPGDIAQRKLPLSEIVARVSGNVDAVEISALELRTPRGPPLVGSGKLAAGTLDLRLGARALDLKRWDPRLIATTLTGSLQITATRENQSVQALLTQADYRLELGAVRKGNLLVLERASAVARGGTLAITGNIALEGSHAFAARGRLQRFDPSAFFDAPRARIDADIDAKGQLAPSLSAALEIRATGRGPRGEAFVADAKGTVQARRVSDLRGKLALGRNELTVAGSYGTSADTLAFEARLPALQEIDRRFAGALEGKGRIAGAPERPQIELDATGSQIGAPGGVKIAALRVRGSLPADWEKAIEFEATAANARIDTLEIGKASAVVRGTPRSHAIDLAAQGKQLDFQARLTGGLSSLRAWDGELSRAEMIAPTRVSLLAPARVALAEQRIEVGRFTLSAMDARFSSRELVWTPSTFHSSGDFTRLSLSPFLGGLRNQVQSSLVLTGDWNLEERGGVLRGALKMARESGDVVLTGETRLPLALTALHVEANVADNQLRAMARASSSQLGEFRLQLSSQMARQGRLWVLPATAPLALEAQGEFASIAWLGPLIHPTVIAAGKASLNVSGQGTVGQPRLDGSIRGEALAIRIPATGVALTDGVLDARFEGDRIVVRSMRLKGGEGFVTLSGEVGLHKTTSARLKVDANKLMLLDRRDAQVELDAAGEVVMGEGMLRIKADARVTRGYLDLLSKLDRPSLAADIRVKSDKPAPPARQPLKVFVDLNTDFGDRFEVRASRMGVGAGSALSPVTGDFKARVQGKIHTRSDASQIPQTTGHLQVVDGTYSVLGRRFKVERGNLNFVGALNNPALDIYVAAASSTLRFTPDVGISITGTAAAPRIRLVSVPDMPETEKLSWLLFGRGGQTFDYSASGAAGQIAAPVTEFGWQLSQKLYLAYEQSTTGTSNVVRIYSQLTDRIAIQLGAGDANSLFLLYTFTF
jgi:translocation and assembly module TamB